MKTICALVDINIIVDDMAKREPFAKLSHDILVLCAQGKFIGYISAHTIPTIISPEDFIKLFDDVRK
jgi:hypothetical protein